MWTDDRRNDPSLHPPAVMGRQKSADYPPRDEPDCFLRSGLEFPRRSCIRPVSPSPVGIIASESITSVPGLLVLQRKQPAEQASDRRASCLARKIRGIQ